MSAVNLFPANVITPERKLLKTRVQIKDGKARVFQMLNGAIDLALEEEVAEYKPSNNRFAPTQVILASGETWQIKRASGCGCGNPLRNFDPATWGNP